MLWYNDKKINAAFGRLRDKRAAVGLTSQKEKTVEEEAKELEQQIAAATASQNIGAVIALITQASAHTPKDYVNMILGSMRFLYYSFLNRYHVRPIDFIDLVDGLLFMDAYGYLEKKEYEKISAATKK